MTPIDLAAEQRRQDALWQPPATAREGELQRALTELHDAILNPTAERRHGPDRRQGSDRRQARLDAFFASAYPRPVPKP